MSLKHYSMKEIESEIKRREKILEEMPTKKENIDWTPVFEIAERILLDMATGEWHPDNDNATYMYEAVMMAIYGDKIFDWTRKNQ